MTTPTTITRTLTRTVTGPVENAEQARSVLSDIAAAFTRAGVIGDNDFYLSADDNRRMTYRAWVSENVLVNGRVIDRSNMHAEYIFALSTVPRGDVVEVESVHDIARAGSKVYIADHATVATFYCGMDADSIYDIVEADLAAFERGQLIDSLVNEDDDC